jgi:hypothetical protein
MPLNARPESDNTEVQAIVIDGLKPEAAAVLAGRADPSTLLNKPILTATPEAKPAEAAPVAKPGTNESGKPAAAAPEQKPVEIKDEDLETRLVGKETTENEIGRLKRDYAASSKEAIRLNKANKALRELLDEQHLNVAEGDDGIPVALAPKSTYSKAVKELDLKFADLSEEEQGLFADDPQKAIDFIKGKATKALLRVAPTVESFTKAITPEREQTAIEYVKGLTDDDGEKKHPGFEKNLPAIKKYLAHPSVPKGLKDAFNQAPETMLEVLSCFVDVQRAALLRVAQKELQKKNPDRQPPLGPSSGHAPVAGGDVDWATAKGREIASAKLPGQF